MFGQNRHPAPPYLFEGFEPDEQSSTALDNFKSAIITAYERALDDGISSSVALAAMLDMASTELMRTTHLNG
jgi:hypothetical protein